MRRRFGKTNKITDAWRKRQLFVVGRIDRLKKDRCPPMLLTDSVDSKRIQGRRFRTIYDSFAENTKTMIPEVGARGRVGDWIGCSKVSEEWERMVKKGEQRERGEFNSGKGESDGEYPEEQLESKSVPPADVETPM